MSLRDNAKNLSDLDLLDVSDMEVKESAKVLSIPKSEIYAIEQVRQTFDDEKIQEMKNSLEIEGQIQPIIVSDHDGRGYCIQKGERRWRGAMVSEDITHLDCIVRPQGTIWGQLAENLIREDLNPFELGAAIAKGKAEFNIDNNGVAKKLGISPAKVSAFLKAIEAPEIVKTAFNEGNIGDVDTINSLRIAHDIDPKIVETVVNSPVSRSDAKALVKELKQSKNGEGKEQPSSEPTQPKKKKAQVTTTIPGPIPSTLRVEIDGEQGMILFVAPRLPADITVKLDSGCEIIVDAKDIRLLGYV